MPEPLRLPPPLSRLPWDIAQSQFGGQGTDFIGVLSALLQRDTQSQFRAYLADLPRLPDTLPPASAQSQFAPVRESLQQGTVENEARVSFSTVPCCRDSDRKSTRLNSSHTVISYAVFCLKKKKNKKQEQIICDSRE